MNHSHEILLEQIHLSFNYTIKKIYIKRKIKFGFLIMFSPCGIIKFLVIDNI